jgi:hypothetical protein
MSIGMSSLRTVMDEPLEIISTYFRFGVVEVAKGIIPKTSLLVMVST